MDPIRLLMERRGKHKRTPKSDWSTIELLPDLTGGGRSISLARSYRSVSSFVLA